MTDEVGINWKLPKRVHHAAKVAAAQQGVTLKQFVIEAVRVAAQDQASNWKDQQK